jgi:hypothetical protein
VRLAAAVALAVVIPGCYVLGGGDARDDSSTWWMPDAYVRLGEPVKGFERETLRYEHGLDYPPDPALVAWGGAMAGSTPSGRER